MYELRFPQRRFLAIVKAVTLTKLRTVTRGLNASVRRSYISVEFLLAREIAQDCLNAWIRS